MSNDNRSDDDLISELYDASKQHSAQQNEPPLALNKLILAKAKMSVKSTVSDDEVTENIVVELPTKNPKRRWFVPQSLAGCLVISVLVGLVFRENSDYFSMGDSVDLSEESVLRDVVAPNGRSIEKPVSLFPERKKKAKKMLRAPLPKKESAHTFGQSSLQSRFAAPVESVVTADSVVDATSVAVGAVDELVEAVEMEALSVVADDIELSYQGVLLEKLDAIREARDAGELELTSTMINDLLLEYPELALPKDLVAFKK